MDNNVFDLYIDGKSRLIFDIDKVVDYKYDESEIIKELKMFMKAYFNKYNIPEKY